MDQADLNNRANLKNPNHWSYWKSRGYPVRPRDWRYIIDENEYDADDRDSRNNRANQKNPNHKSYWTSRGYSDRPYNWRELIREDEYEPEPKTSLIPRTGTTATDDSSSSSAAGWIVGGLAVGIGLLAAVAAVSDACKEEDTKDKKSKK